MQLVVVAVVVALNAQDQALEVLEAALEETIRVEILLVVLELLDKVPLVEMLKTATALVVEESLAQEAVDLPAHHLATAAVVAAAE
jgi:hypothetical protein